MRTLTLLLVVALAGPAAAQEECQFPLSDYEKIDAAIKAAPTCAASAKVFGACLLGASGDVARGGMVQERCERDFLHRLSADRRRAYKAALAACGRKYARQSGTMYRSMEAQCSAGVAVRFSGRYGRR